MNKTSLFIFIFCISLISFTNAEDNYYYQNGKKIYLKPSSAIQTFSLSDKSLLKTKSYTQLENNTPIQITNQILLQTNNDIVTIVEKYPITLLKTITSNIYLVEVDTNQSVLSIANRLYEDKNILFAHPNTIKKIENR